MAHRPQHDAAAINEVLDDMAQILGYGDRANLPMFFTRKQVAQLLGTTAGVIAVWDCVGRVDLGMTKIGNNARYRPVGIARYIVSNTKSMAA